MSLVVSSHLTRPTNFNEIVESIMSDYPPVPPVSEVTQVHNYRFFNSLHTPNDVPKDLVPKFDVYSILSPPRSKILELLRPEDPGRDALEAIVGATPRRGLTRPLDEDTRRFLRRALQPTPYASATPTKPESKPSDSLSSKNSSGEMSLAEELIQAEENKSEDNSRVFEVKNEDLGSELHEAVERDMLAKLALSVEEDEGEEDGLSAASRRIDALLAESRSLHEELAAIQEDLQVLARRVTRRDLNALVPLLVTPTPESTRLNLALCMRKL